MRFVNEIGFCVARGKEEAFQAWLTKNEARLAKSYPPGCEYLGTYVAVFSGGQARRRVSGDRPARQLRRAWIGWLPRRRTPRAPTGS